MTKLYKKVMKTMWLLLYKHKGRLNGSRVTVATPNFNYWLFCLQSLQCSELLKNSCFLFWTVNHRVCHKILFTDAQIFKNFFYAHNFSLMRRPCIQVSNPIHSPIPKDSLKHYTHIQNLSSLMLQIKQRLLPPTPRKLTWPTMSEIRS